MRSLLVAVLATAFICVSSSVNAQAPSLLSFQGFVTDTSGVPINHAGVSIRFRIFEGTTQIWRETQPSVEIVDGVFNVLLGSVVPLDTVQFDRPLFLRIKVGSDGELKPYTPLAAAAYAKALPGLYTFYFEDPCCGGLESYNVVGGAANNVVGPGVTGAAIGGGGGILAGTPVPNQVIDDWGTVGGGASNTAFGTQSTVGGGRLNTAGSSFTTVAGGIRNEATGPGSTIAGGVDNTANGNRSTVGGGVDNTASGSRATVGGGDTNTASGDSSTVAGGLRNMASGDGASVGGGLTNTASGSRATVGGGTTNTASGSRATVGGGFGNTSSGFHATVPGGVDNSARGSSSFAAGHDAKAIHDGTFVWNDRSITTDNDSLLSTGPNQFLIRAAGGVGIGTNAPASQLHVAGGVIISRQGDGAELLRLNTERSWAFRQLSSGAGTNLELASLASGGIGNKNFVINTTGRVGIGVTTPVHPLEMASGAHVTAAGAWTSVSSRARKQDFEAVDPLSILERVADLDVMRWRYKKELESVHMGPVAEDFHEAFNLGADNKHIASLDGNGVALAAIQGLYELVQEQQALLVGQQAEIERLSRIVEGAH